MLKVLIADDEIKVSQLILHLIHWEDFGMEVIGTVNDGIEACETILEKRPDIVITDIRMPGMDGIELVESVTKEIENIFFIIISGYSQFEYARQAVKLGVEDYLLKPIKKKELEAVLNKILGKYKETANSLEERENLLNHLELTREKVKNSFLSELIDNHRQSILLMSREEMFEEFECRLSEKYFTHIVVHLFTNAVMENNKEYGFMLPKIQKVLKEKLEMYCSEWMSIIHNEEVICLLNTAENKREEIIRQLYKVKIVIFSGFKVVIGVGQTVDSLSLYSESMNTANHAIRNRFSKPNELIIEGDSRKESSFQVAEVISSSDKKEILTAMELIDIEAFKKAVSRIKAELKNTGDGQLIYGVYRELVETFVFGVKSYLGQEIKVTMGELMKGYMNLYGFDEVFDWFAGKCCGILLRYEEEQRSQEARPIRMAKQYINENYNKAISLEGVSNHIGFNPAYFSSMFKKATGQNFMDYVIEIRILNAKGLLVQTNLDIADIAAKVGYTDLKYFSRIFKKLTNLTPSEYRRLYS